MKVVTFALLGYALLFSPAAVGQTVAGSITGLVQDSSGAAVPEVAEPLPTLTEASYFAARRTRADFTPSAQSRRGGTGSKRKIRLPEIRD
jgi:hypothetical protein